VIAIDVSDTGIGIPRDKQWVIFEAFQQADGTTSRKYGGTGLGLSISRELVHLLGGQIKLVSRVGQGSTFTFYLPARYPELPEDRPAHDRNGEEGPGTGFPATATRAPSMAEHEPDPALGRRSTGSDGGPDSQLAGHRVLVVDDDVRNVFALTTLLERHGVHVVAAESGDDAVTSLRQDPTIEAVLLDVMMPDKDGYMTMREIRALPRRSGLPIIAVTARAMKGDRERCLEAGATDYVAKPVDTAELLRMLQRAFGTKKRVR
jgi:CheY-like chemotaxis protein